MTVGVRLKVGKVNVRSTRYPSEAGYVKEINQGMAELEKNLKWIIQQFEDVTPEVMLDAMRPMYDKSQVYVPVRGGTLRDSGYLEIVERRGRPTVEMGYAKGGSPDYAVYVHEMIGIPHASPTQAKFLERAVNEEVGATIDRLVANFREFMGE